MIMSLSVKMMKIIKMIGGDDDNDVELKLKIVFPTGKQSYSKATCGYFNNNSKYALK